MGVQGGGGTSSAGVMDGGREQRGDAGGWMLDLPRLV